MSSPGSRTAETGAWLSDECPSRLPLTLFGSESRRTCLTEFFRQSRRLPDQSRPSARGTSGSVKFTPQFDLFNDGAEKCADTGTD
jgi:hypothetical protein